MNEMVKDLYIAAIRKDNIVDDLKNYVLIEGFKKNEYHIVYSKYLMGTEKIVTTLQEFIWWMMYERKG